jgi:hypothetical protein
MTGMSCLSCNWEQIASFVSPEEAKRFSVFMGFQVPDGRFSELVVAEKRNTGWTHVYS